MLSCQAGVSGSTSLGLWWSDSMEGDGDMAWSKPQRRRAGRKSNKDGYRAQNQSRLWRGGWHHDSGGPYGDREEECEDEYRVCFKGSKRGQERRARGKRDPLKESAWTQSKEEWSGLQWQFDVKHEQELELLRSSLLYQHQEDLRKVKRDLSDRYTSEIEELKWKHGVRLGELLMVEDEYHEQLDVLEAQKQTISTQQEEIEKLEKENARLRKVGDQEEMRLRKELEQIKGKLIVEHADKLRQARKEVQEVEQIHKAETEEWKSKWEDLKKKSEEKLSQVEKELESVASEKAKWLVSKEQVHSLEIKQQVACEEIASLIKVVEEEKAFKTLVMSQLHSFLGLIGLESPEENEGNTVTDLMEVAKESLAKMKEEKQSLISLKDEHVLLQQEMQSLREELELTQAEKEKLSTSVRDVIQGAESYKNLLIAFDKQAEQLDFEKERSHNFEHQIGDLARQLEVSLQQQDQLRSANEDLTTRIETLQTNTKLLEAQLLEIQKVKVGVDKEFESEKLLKEQKIQDRTNAVKDVEELQAQLQKEKKHLQKILEELELAKKDAQKSTLMNMKMADYQRLVKELSQKITDKNSRIEELEQDTKIQKQREETLQEEIKSCQTSIQRYEEENSKVKQLLVKTRKELADSKQSENELLRFQASLKEEIAEDSAETGNKVASNYLVTPSKRKGARFKGAVVSKRSHPQSSSKEEQETKQKQKNKPMVSAEDVKCMASKKEQIHAEMTKEKVSKAIGEVQLQSVSKELGREVSVLQREVTMVREFVGEKDWELETGQLRDISCKEVPSDRQKTVSKQREASEARKSVLTEQDKELQFRKEKAFQKKQLIWTQQQETTGAEDLIGDWMPMERFYQLWRVEKDLMEYYKKRSMYPDDNLVSRQETGPTSKEVEDVAPVLLGGECDEESREDCTALRGTGLRSWNAPLPWGKRGSWSWVGLAGDWSDSWELAGGPEWKRLLIYLALLLSVP